MFKIMKKIIKTTVQKGMPGFSATKQKFKQTRSQYSFSNLSQTTTTGESTKKTIEAEQISHYEAQSIKDSKISFSLPYNVQIPSIMSQLTNLFSEEIIHVEEDSQGGKILLNGIKNKSKKRWVINMLDCLGLFCWKYGLNGGALYETYSILNNRCFISIEQLPFHEEDRNTFMSEIVLRIQQELKKIDTNQERHMEGTGTTRYLAFDSIFLQEMEIKEKLYGIFIYEKDSKWERFRRLFRKSEENIRQKIGEFRAKMSKKEQNLTNKKQSQSQNPSSLIQTVITESESLYRLLVNYYEKEAEQENDIMLLGGILGSPVQKQFTLYSIEEIISGQFMDSIIECYEVCTEQQCQVFNKNAKQINQKLSNSQIFDYLQLRDKFRLVKLENPYHPSIQILKSAPNATSPRELLLSIQKVFSSVKVDCLKASKGKIELSSMDDLLPVMIFVTAKANVFNFPAFVKIIDDYIRLKSVFELQERIITTLYVAVQDITKKWNA